MYSRWKGEDEPFKPLSVRIEILISLIAILVYCEIKFLLMRNENKSNKHNVGLQRTDPGTKVTKGHIFPPNALNGILLFPSF